MPSVVAMLPLIDEYTPFTSVASAETSSSGASTLETVWGAAAAEAAAWRERRRKNKCTLLCLDR